MTAQTVTSPVNKYPFPGPRLDVAVAVAVFGCRVVKNHSYADSEYGTRPYCNPSDGGMCLAPKYSADWGAAGLVVDRLGKLGFEFYLYHRLNGEWDASFVKWGQPCSMAKEYTSAPHAICLAALEALDNQADAKIDSPEGDRCKGCRYWRRDMASEIPQGFCRVTEGWDITAPDDWCPDWTTTGFTNRERMDMHASVLAARKEKAEALERAEVRSKLWHWFKSIKGA